MKYLQDVISAINPNRHVGDLDRTVKGLSIDSRKVEDGFLYIAQKGTQRDGHDFINNAIANGATSILHSEKVEVQKGITYICVEDTGSVLGKVASCFYDHPSQNIKLIGVTGTNGKTTIATLLYRLFRQLGYEAGLLSTVCNYIGGRAVPATHTTPDAISINALMSEMLRVGCEFCFMEVSSHAIDQQRIEGLDFDGGVFTNLTRDHLDYHNTFEAYRDTKKHFFDTLKPQAFALANVDDKNGKFMLQNTKAFKRTHSCRAMADYRVKIIDHSFDGMMLQFDGREVFMQFVGAFNAANLAAVFAAAMELDANKDEVLLQMSTLKPVDGRFETIQSGGVTAIVDYAHTPDALSNVLKTINAIRQGTGRLIVVVGAGGNRDKGKRPLMAKEAAEAGNQVILTSDNPRNEAPDAIIKDMMEGVNAAQSRKTLCISDRKEAIKTALSFSQAGDVVLIAGKGHETYQEIKGVRHHFDDREIVKEFINH